MIRKLSLGQYFFKKYTFVPYLPLKVHVDTLKVDVSA